MKPLMPFILLGITAIFAWTGLYLVERDRKIKCKNEAHDVNFKPHIVMHFHKSKKYAYYHNTPCECREYGHYYHKDYKQDPRDYIIK